MPWRTCIVYTSAAILDILQLLINNFSMVALSLAYAVLHVNNIVGEYPVEVLTR